MSCLKLLVLVVLLNIVSSTLGANLFERYWVRNAESRKALCNDHTPAGYYVRKGTTDDWVIRLQGGGWCWDVPTCEGRLKYSPYWTTSKYLPAQMNDTDRIGPAGHGGILSSDPKINPYFSAANHVYIWYCSSDSHLGRKDASPETNNWAFYGKHIIQGIMEDLLQNEDFRFTSAKNILITGDSAGGVGAINNLDWMVETFRPHLAKTTKFRGFIDAGWFLDIPTYKKSTTSFQQIAKNLLKNWDVLYDQTCVNELKADAWKCFHTQYLHPYITTPLIYHEFLYDAANLGFDGVGKPYTPEKMEFINAFRDKMLAFLTPMPNVFSPACDLHEVEDSDYFSDITVKGKKFGSQVLGEYFYNDSQDTHFIDSCDTLDCNPTCPAQGM